MMKLIVAFTYLVFAAVIPAAAQQFIAIPTCPQGFAYGDGCQSAPRNGSVQHSDFFTSYALQSGQAYVARPPWNVAGVDYAVGYPTTTVFKNPNVDALPTGCAKNGSPVQIVCQNSSANVTFDGWDFSLNSCIHLQTNANYTGNLTIKNSKFGYGSNCSTRANLLDLNGGASLTMTSNSFDGNGIQWLQDNKNAIALVSWQSNLAPVTATYNVFIHSPVRFFTSASSGNETWQFNYFEGLNAESIFQASINSTTMTVTSVVSGTVPIKNGMTVFDGGAVQSAGTKICDNTICTQAGSGTGGVGTYSINHSFSLGVLPYQSNFGNHGDPLLLNFGSGAGLCASNCVMGTMSFQFNTLLAPNNWGGGTAGITPYEGIRSPQGTTITTLNADHNTLIANALGGATGNGAVSYSTIGVQVAYVTVTTANVSANYVDPTGAFHCFSITSGGGITNNNTSGNVNLLDSSTPDFSGDASCHGHL